MPGSRRERVEVHDEQADGLDAVALELGAVLGLVEVGQQPGVDGGVERDHPVAEDGREPGQLGDVGDREAGVGRAPRPSRRSTPAASPARAGRWPARRCRSCRRRTAARCSCRLAHAAAASAMIARVQAALDGLDALVQRGLVVAGQHGHGLLGQDRAVVDLSVATWTVQPVTLTPAASASRTACAPGKAGSSDGWVLRIRSGNASNAAWPRTVMNPAMATRSMPCVLEGPRRPRRCRRHGRSRDRTRVGRTSTAGTPAAVGHLQGTARPIGDHDQRAQPGVRGWPPASCRSPRPAPPDPSSHGTPAVAPVRHGTRWATVARRYEEAHLGRRDW